MDYEKKYKNALEWARQVMNGETGFIRKEVEEVFPELKESEDERVRKSIIAIINNYVDNSNTFKPKMLSWLEKQEELKSSKWTEGDVVRHGGILALVTNGRKAMKSNCEQITIQYPDEWVKAETKERKYFFEELEKQGEQKSMKVYRVENEAEQKGLWRKFDGTWQPLFDMLTDGKCKDMPMEDNPIYREGGKRWFASAPSKEALQKWFSKRDLEELISKGFTISEFEVVGYKKVSDFEYIFTRDNIINRNHLEVSDIYSEQNDFTPKVKPKFKVGDWIVDNMGIAHQVQRVVENVTNHTFGYDIVGGGYFNDDSDVHLWTIKDAKDGDILTTENFIFIFKNIDNDNGVHYYCHYEINKHEDDNQFDIALPQSLMGKVGNNISHYSPATKEQQNILMKAITDAGYEWNENKKELKKISQRMISAEAKEALYSEPTWSEEDEDMIDSIYEGLQDVSDELGWSGFGQTPIDDIVNWLKSLKQRLGE